jgi:archaemetzincin
MKKNWLLVLVLFVFSCNEQSDFDKLAEIDIRLHPTQAGEWLADHPEKGQTFQQYIKIKPVTTTETKNCVYIQPIGDFTVQESKIVDYTVEYVELFFDLKTVKLPTIKEASIPNDHKRIIDNNEQLDASYINREILPKKFPKDGIVIMAITAKDLYPDPTWNYVFGLANYEERTGISSFFRFSDKKLSEINYSLCLKRIIKTSTHEIGHMFTISHCTNAVCLMNGVNSLSEDDTKPTSLCSECLHKLSWNLKFDNKKRFQKLIAFLELHRLDEEVAILRKQLEVIQ